MPHRYLCTWHALITNRISFVCPVLLSPVMKTIKMLINDNHNRKIFNSLLYVSLHQFRFNILNGKVIVILNYIKLQLSTSKLQLQL